MRRNWRWRNGRGLVMLFAATVVLPALVLAVLALRALDSDRELAERVWRERLDEAARRTYGELERRVRNAQVAADALARGERAAPRDGLIRLLLAPEVEAQPAGEFAWLPAGKDVPLPPQLARAEVDELRLGKAREAAATYERLLKTEPARWRGWVALRLARAWRVAGERERALRALRVAAAEQDSPGPVATRLAARFELCAALEASGERQELRKAASRLYREIGAGTWRLEKASYAFYAKTLREWSGEISATDAHREALSRLLERVMAGEAGWIEEDGRAVLALRASQGREAAALVPEGEWERWVAETVKGMAAELVVRVAAQKPRDSDWRRSLSLAALGVPRWIVSEPRDPRAPVRDREGRRRMLTVALALVAGVLAFGSLATAWLLQRELRVARLQSDFAATVSHEFRSPLTGIRQLGEMLLAGRAAHDEERRRQYYELICKESDRLTRLVENVLDFARIEDGRKRYRFEKIQTQDWLRELAGIAGRRRTMETTLPPEVPAVEGDREALSSAVLNLLDNAIKYSPEGAPVSLRASCDDGWVTIEVADKGFGIPLDEQRRIFDRFYRSSETDGGSAKGVGLGLALAKKIAEAHGAKIRVESAPGEGSRFFLSLRAAT